MQKYLQYCAFVCWRSSNVDLDRLGPYVNSLGPSSAIWRQRCGWTLVQVMACCLTAPSHYLIHFWLIISKVEWHSSEGKFTRDASAINHWNYLENYVPKISFKFPRGQWVKPETTVVSFVFHCHFSLVVIRTDPADRTNGTNGTCEGPTPVNSNKTESVMVSIFVSVRVIISCSCMVPM